GRGKRGGGGSLDAGGPCGEERGGGGVGELVAKSFGEEQADYPGAPEPQPARRRVRPRVTERLRGGKHPLAHLLRDELRMTERLRRASDGDAGALGDIA